MSADPGARRRALSLALDAIDTELAQRYPGLPEPSPDDVANGGAFGIATMAFPQWLRFVFVPVARRRIADDDLPSASAVAAQAVRELDGDDRATPLLGLLADFDLLVTAP